MRHTLRVLSAVLCVLLCSAVYAQTAASNVKLPSEQNSNVMSFHYDAQHDQVVASGVQLRPNAIAEVNIPPTTGTLRVTININDVSHFVPSTSYHCSLTAIGGILDTTNAVIAGGIETAFGVAHWTGTNALSCTLRIPYSWTLPPDPAALRGAVLAFGVSAVAPGSGAIQRSTLQVEGVAPIPASGSTSTFTFNVTL